MKYTDLFEGCKKGDARAQRLLYELYSNRLMGLCRRYTRDRDAAADVLQESFIKIFRSIDQVSAAEKMEGWMKVVTVRTAIDHYHKSKTRDLFFSPMDEHVEYEKEVYESLENISDEYLLAVVNGLPDGCRVIFNLFAIEGYSHTEIAEMLKVSEGTSRSQFHYARQLIMTKLKCSNLNHYYEKFA